MTGKVTAAEAGLKQIERQIRADEFTMTGMGLSQAQWDVSYKRGLVDAGIIIGVRLMVELMTDPDVEGPA